jgi:hypothetical protein
VVRRARETVCMVTYRREGVDCWKNAGKEAMVEVGFLVIVVVFVLVCSSL